MQNDPLFGIHGLALNLRSQRAALLAENIANANTPGYRAKDIDFKALLNDAAPKMVHMQATSNKHISGSTLTGGVTPQEREVEQATLDGNTVDANVEHVEFSRNALQYQTSLQFMDTRMRMLMQAFKGE